ncbi:MAG: phage baseplate assembly protein V [Oscillospiraceae bacterium]|nr:phage baseplate assembly protein V [Oscillospiraceae bacterium]
MSITDIFEETSKKMMNKNMTGDTIIPGVMIGIVVENNNNKFPGMIRVKIPTRDDKKNIFQWMKVISVAGGKNWGMYCLPEIGEEVVVVFENGNINKAYVIGSIFKNDSQVLSDGFSDENYKKIFLTKGGNKIFIDDETDKQKVIVSTKEGHSVSLDDEDKSILLKDKDKKNIIKIDSENGKINIMSESKLEIDIGGIKIEMIGDSKKITVKCDSLDIDSSRVKVEGDNISIKATTFDVSASSSAKIASNGLTQIKGSTVKLS